MAEQLSGMYQEIWRPRDSPFHFKVDLSSLLPTSDIYLQNLNKLMLENSKLYLSMKDDVHLTEKLCSYYFISALYKLGWKPKVGDGFTTEKLMTDLLVSPANSRYLNRMLEVMSEDDILQETFANGEVVWVVHKNPLSNSEVRELIEKLQTADLASVDNAIHKFGEQVSDFLCEKFSGTDLLSDEQKSSFNSSILHKGGIVNQLATLRASAYVQVLFTQLKNKNAIVRILQVGAGSYATTKEIITGLQKQGIQFRYTFTTISSHLLTEAKKSLKHISTVDYKLLNIENDPKRQGFAPYSYDVIVADNVLHGTEYLQSSLANVRQLLAPSGVLLLMEILKPIRYIDMICGTVENYWRFKDIDIRSNHPFVNEKTWCDLLQKSGFSSVKNISEDQEYVGVLIAEATSQNFIYKPREESTSLDSKSPTWIIFAGDNQRIANDLRVLIENAGDSVFLVGDSNQAGNNSQFGYIVNYSDENEIGKLMTACFDNYDVKGCILLIGLDDSNDQNYLGKTTLNICKYFCVSGKPCKIIIATRGVYYFGDQGHVDPSKATLPGILKSSCNEHRGLKGYVIDLDPDDSDPIAETNQIFFQMWNSDNEYLVAFRKNKRFVLRHSPLTLPQAQLLLPNSCYEIAIPKTRSIDDVTFKILAMRDLKPNEVEVAVRAVALNFRDVLVILKPNMYFTDWESTVGTDFSGVVTRVGSDITKYKIGDEVFGISKVSSVASHVIVTAGCIVPKPKNLSFAEASTLPTVFLTAYLTLVVEGNLQRNETVLIHVASGGVGLAAIQIAKEIGAKIIATAGSKRKRAYLRSLGIENVFHSRDLTFGAEVQKITGDKGVDLILNSLTGPGFKEMSLKVCGKDARFIEMGKINIWQPDEVKRLRPDVKYTIVDLEKVEDSLKESWLVKMAEKIQDNIVKPFPFTRFSIYQIRESLQYFLKAQHIGKIVVEMPETKEYTEKSYSNDLLFNKNSTYLVTGGLGGIGLQIGKWTVQCGAEHLVLVGRSAPNENTQEVLKSLSAKGIQVLVHQLDVGDLKQCQELFETIKNEMPPLKGIFHAAGQLSDKTVKKQTWENFETVFNAKINGGWNLHNLTKSMNLDHFILFSSVAGIFGANGQSNYSAANMFLDSLAHYRHALGLPAQSIDWGPWSEIGAAANTVFGKEGAFGIYPLKPDQGIAALGYIMTRPYTQIAVVQLDAPTLTKPFPNLRAVLSELIPANNS